MARRRWSGSRGLGSNLAWLLGLVALAAPLPPGWSQGLDRREDFGRWQTRPRHCQLVRTLLVRTASSPPSRLGRGCRSVRLDQQLPGLLSLRFSEAGPNARLSDQVLTLAGVLKPGSRAMDCRDGRCQPHWPLTLRVSAMAERGFNPQQNLSQLPQARLAQGDCRLDAAGARCLVNDNDGLAWQVEVAW